jgi:protein-disulfide isomerase
VSANTSSRLSIRWAAVGLVVAAAPVLAAGQSTATSNLRAVAALPGISITQKGPEAAPITVIEFSDFECPSCATVPPVMAELLDQYPGQIRFVFKHSPLRIHPNAPLAHEAALAAGLQGRFWEMHDLLFANQKRLSMADLTGYATQLQLDVPAFTAALADHRLKPVVDQDLLEARAYGVTATPTFFINGQRYSGAATLATLKGFVEQALGHSPMPTPATVSSGPRVGHINVDGAPMRGAEDAPVTIVEFTDLQCPFCAQSVPIMRQVMAAYDGKVKWLFKSFPLSIHPNAMLAHQAVLAAAEQGKFWAMHDALFADQKSVKREALPITAERLGLDLPRFAADLDSPSVRSRIEKEREEGTALGVTGTPTFFINGRQVVGAKSFAEMKAIVDQELAGRPVTAAELGTPVAAAPMGPDLSRGEPNAPVTIVWYSDFRSTLTPKAAALVRLVMDAYPSQIRVIVKHRPSESRPESRLVHEAAVAAAAQGKFWEMHDLILAEPPGPLDRDRLVDLARRVGLNEAQFAQELDGSTYRASVERDLDEATRRAVRGTPVFFVNGQRIDGIQPLSYFKRIVDAELQRRTDK